MKRRLKAFAKGRAKSLEFAVLGEASRLAVENDVGVRLFEQTASDP
jgi:hypothetical protein